MQILINALDKIKKEISPASSLYDRGWNDALEKAKSRLKANVNFELTMELLLLTIKEN